MQSLARQKVNDTFGNVQQINKFAPYPYTPTPYSLKAIRRHKKCHTKPHHTAATVKTSTNLKTEKWKRVGFGWFDWLLFQAAVGNISYDQSNTTESKYGNGIEFSTNVFIQHTESFEGARLQVVIMLTQRKDLVVRVNETENMLHNFSQVGHQIILIWIGSRRNFGLIAELQYGPENISLAITNGLVSFFKLFFTYSSNHGHHTLGKENLVANCWPKEIRLRHLVPRVHLWTINYYRYFPFASVSRWTWFYCQH